jgi:NADH:ubiquinone oxidoreductase subunit 2 (subunit N)
MAGIPPCIGFFGKFLILLSSISAQNLNFMILIAIATSVVSTVYYLKLIKIIHFDKSDSELVYSSDTISQNIVFSNALVIAILSLIILLFILNPTPIMNLIHIISLGQII